MDNFQDMSVIQTLKMEVSVSLFRSYSLQFLMCLQKRDYQTANKLQKELSKRCPDDKNIQEFADFLPEEARAQKKEIEGEPESEYDSEYDEEEDDEPEEKSSSEDEEPVQEDEKPADTHDYGDPGSDYEWASDVDSQGK